MRHAPECIIMTLILMVTCSTYYLHWTHGPKIHDREKYRFRKPHVHAGCSIEADCSIYSTCVSGKCVVFWPAPRSNITCQCLSDIINYENHFYLKHVSSVQYHKGPTSKTCVITYRWSSHQQSGTGSTVKEYEERDSGALLRREFISRNSASLVALCKAGIILKTLDEPETKILGTPRVETHAKEAPHVKILYHGTCFGGTFNRMYKVSTLEDTKMHRAQGNVCTTPCSVTHSEIKDADIVLFHGPATSRISRVKKSGQWFGLHSMESQGYYGQQKPHSSVMEQMNVHLSTKLKPQQASVVSVPAPYFSNFEYGSFMNPVQPKKGLAIWMHNNCNSVSRRSKLVKDLMQYMKIDSYGRCLHNKNDVRSSKNPVELVAQYKFYIMLENVFDDTDWVSSTYFRIIAAGSVPVYKGAPNIDFFSPSNHSIIKWDDFESTEKLAKYLLYLDNNDEEYNKYLSWKKTGPSESFKKLVSIIVYIKHYYTIM